jgi:hypothetical protein
LIFFLGQLESQRIEMMEQVSSVSVNDKKYKKQIFNLEEQRKALELKSKELLLQIEEFQNKQVSLYLL